MPPELLGPLGLTVALGIGLIALWRDHLRADADDRAKRDEAFGLLETSLTNNRDAIAAWNHRIEDDATRRRKADS